MLNFVSWIYASIHPSLLTEGHWEWLSWNTNLSAWQTLLFTMTTNHSLPSPFSSSEICSCIQGPTSLQEPGILHSLRDESWIGLSLRHMAQFWPIRCGRRLAAGFSGKAFLVLFWKSEGKPRLISSALRCCYVRMRWPDLPQPSYDHKGSHQHTEAKEMER